MEEEIELPSLRSIGVKFGIIAGLLGIMFTIVIDVTGNLGNQGLQYSGLIITLAVVFFAHREYKNNGDGFMNYGQGVGIGAWIGLVGSVISSVFTYVYVSFINTEYVSTLKDIQRMKMEEQGLSDAQIDQAMEITGAFMTPVALLGMGLFMGVLFTVIIALIVSAFTKKARPELV